MLSPKMSLLKSQLIVIVLILMMFSGQAIAAAGDNIAVIQDNLNNILPFPKNSVQTMKNAANQFYGAGNQDTFDFLFVWMVVGTSSSDAEYLPEAYAVSKGPSGTNAPNPGVSPADFGSAGHLKAIGNMYAIVNYPSDINQPYSHYTLTFPPMAEPSAFGQISIIARAMMRYWGAYLELPGGNSGALLGGNGFYSYFFNNGERQTASVLGGNSFSQLGPTDFNVYASSRLLTPLDLYLMGFGSADDVDNLFYLTNVDMDPPRSPSSPPDTDGAYIGHAERVDLTIQDIINKNGQVNADGVQKDFRCAFILVVPDGASADPVDISKLEKLRTRFQSWFIEQTDRQGSMDCTLDGTGEDGDITDGDIGRCTEGDRRCNLKVIEECDANGNWRFVSECRPDELCIDDECVDESDVDGDSTDGDEPDCTQGQTRCKDDIIQQCGNGEWFDFQDCSQIFKVCHNAACVDPGDVPDDGDIEDGDTTDGDVTTDGDTGCDCPANNRCLSNGTCEPCPEGTVLSGNVCFTDPNAETDGGGGGCNGVGAFGVLPLAALAFATALRRRRRYN